MGFSGLNCLVSLVLVEEMLFKMPLLPTLAKQMRLEWSYRKKEKADKEASIYQLDACTRHSRMDMGFSGLNCLVSFVLVEEMLFKMPSLPTLAKQMRLEWSYRKNEKADKEASIYQLDACTCHSRMDMGFSGLNCLVSLVLVEEMLFKMPSLCCIGKTNEA